MRRLIWFGTLAGLLALTPASVLRAQHAPVGRRGALRVAAATPDTSQSPECLPESVADVKVARNGHLYVLDPLARAVKVFDASGKCLFKFGSSGRGPGEFIAMDGLEVGDQFVSVRDSVLRKREFFRLDGRYARMQRIARDDVAGRYPLRGGTTLVSDVASSNLTLALERRARKVDTLFTMLSATAYLEWPQVLPAPTRVVPRFGSGGAWAVLGDSLLATADGYTGAVSWYSITGSGARRIREATLTRSAAPVVPDELADETARLATAAIQNRSNAAELRDRVAEAHLSRAPQQWSNATRALFSRDGTLWIGVNRITSLRVDDQLVHIGKANTWTVFPREGAPFTVDLRPLFRLTDVRNDMVYGYELDGEGNRVVSAYRLTALVR